MFTTHLITLRKRNAARYNFTVILEISYFAASFFNAIFYQSSICLNLVIYVRKLNVCKEVTRHFNNIVRIDQCFIFIPV